MGAFFFSPAPTPVTIYVDSNHNTLGDLAAGTVVVVTCPWLNQDIQDAFWHAMRMVSSEPWENEDGGFGTTPPFLPLPVLVSDGGTSVSKVVLHCPGHARVPCALMAKWRTQAKNRFVHHLRSCVCEDIVVCKGSYGALF